MKFGKCGQKDTHLATLTDKTPIWE